MKCDNCGWDMDGVEDNQCLRTPDCYKALEAKYRVLDATLTQAKQDTVAEFRLREKAEKELSEALEAIQAYKAATKAGKKGRGNAVPGSAG